MKKQTLKITESQFKRVIETIINEQTTSPGDISRQARAVIGALLPATGEGGDVSGSGTNEEKFLAAIKMITSVDLYNEINIELPRTNIEYKNILNVINKEFNPSDTSDLYWLGEMAKHFKTIGLNLTYGKTDGSIKLDVGTGKQDDSKPQDSAKVTKEEAIDIFNRPGNLQLEDFITKTGLECVREATFGRANNGRYMFGKGPQGFFLRFYLSEDNRQTVTIFINATVWLNILDADGKAIKKMATAKCNNEMIDIIDSYGDKSIILTFDPKNPVKQGAPKKTGLPPAKSWDDVKQKKGYLYRGMSGDLIGELQDLINKGSANTDQINVTKTFDAATLAKVKEIQANMGVKADGVVGPLTYEKLQQRVRFNVKDTGAPETPVAPLEPKPVAPVSGKIGKPTVKV